jgi:RNA polymerase sigma factor (sigma-70 family)
LRENSEKVFMMTVTHESALFMDRYQPRRTTTAPTNDARPPSMALSIDELLAAAGEGSPAAWEEIMRRYGNIVRARVRSFRLQNADALDAVQMTWLRLAENVHQIQFPERLGGWLATTASRECLRIIRQAKHTPYTVEAVTENVADPSIGPEKHVIDADTAQELWNLVAELPPRRRSLLRALFTDDPLPYSEVAHTIGIPTGSIGPTRARALQQLRRMADERGLGQAI